VAALVEPLACCLHGIERAQIEAGQTVAVLGVGPIGLMLCAAAKDAGANVIAVGGREERRELVRYFGAVPGDGQGADIVIEAAGTDESWDDAVELARAGGKVVFFGGRERGTEVAVDTYRLHYEELTVLGSFHHTPRTVRAALAFLASGAHPWERLVTHQVGLDEVVSLFEHPPPDLLKAAVIP
jgi:L-iditol 2-dehydrogenase